MSTPRPSIPKLYAWTLVLCSLAFAVVLVVVVVATS